jgi:hypothetical protein
MTGDLRHNPTLLTQQGQEQVAGQDFAVAIFFGQALGFEHCFLSFFGKFI